MKKTLCALFLAVSFMLSGCMGLGISKPDIALATYNTSIENSSISSKYIDGLKVFSEDALLCYFENTEPEEFEDNLSQIATEKHDLIFVNQGYGWDALQKIAPEHPDKMFGIVDAYNKVLPSNVVNISYKYYEGTYLAGLVAGKTISGNKLGILCEVEDEVTQALIYSFMAGALTGGGNINFEVKYLGIDYDNNDAQNAATELYRSGCEIVFQNLINPNGAINAAENENKYIIGLGLDQSLKSSSHVLTTVVINYDIAFSTVVRKFINKENIGGQTYEFGVSDYVISLAKTNTHINKEILTQVNRVKEDIISEDIKVPHTLEEVEEIRKEVIKNPVVKTPPENNTPNQK